MSPCILMLVYATAKVMSHIRDHFRLENVVNLMLCLVDIPMCTWFRKLYGSGVSKNVGCLLISKSMKS